MAVIATAAPLPALAAGPVAFAVPAGPLAQAVIAVGAQANVTIGIVDPVLAATPVAGLRGTMSVERALARLTAGIGARVERVDGATFRIVRRPRAAPPAPAMAASAAPADIVVTGSKRGTPLARYPGSVEVVGVAGLRAATLGRGTDALADAAPILATTHLGPGRNKVFIRGIADSSFNGPTQSTVGEYLGDARLNYNAPDPDLALYDVSSVEILEGPQGTLYGAGTLGGIMRLVPNPPDMAHVTGSLAGGGGFASRGAASGDASAVLNLPLVPGRLALRGVGYFTRDGGYIDDPSRGLTDVNVTRTKGGRATLRFTPGSDWTIDLVGALQYIDTSDGQYAERGLPPLTRDSVIAQPFDNDYRLGNVVVRHRIGKVDLVSTTSIVSQDIGSTYDASPSAAEPTRYVEDNSIFLVGNETRLSHTGSDGGGWLIGGQYLHSRSRISRTLGPVGSEPGIAGTLNTVDEGAFYGEATVRIVPRLFVTGGGRLALDHLVGRVIDEPAEQPEVRRQELSALPSAGLLFQAKPRLALFARYQEGYRPGGLSVQAGATQRFEADSVATWELGARFGAAPDRIGGTVAVSYAHWEDVQADLVDAEGLPYTANIGSGHVLGLEARAHWTPVKDAAIEAALFANQSALDKPAPAFAGARDNDLPNIADIVARIGGRYDFGLLGHRATVSASLRYVGHSRLGVGPTLDFRQGRYLDSATGLDIAFGRVTFSIDADNLANARRNIFSLGDPFGVMRGNQITPQRPRTIRFGLASSF